MSSLTAAAKDSFCLVDFFWGPTLTEFHLGITDSSAALFRDGKTYLPEPSMEIDLPSTTGGLDDKDARIQIPITSAQAAIADYTSSIATGRAWPPTEVVIREIQMSPSDGTQERLLHHFAGTLEKSIVNPEGLPEVLRIECVWEKSRLERKRLGMIATEDCANIYGQEGCRKQISLYPAGSSSDASQWHYVRLFSFGGTQIRLEPESQDPAEFIAIGGPSSLGIDKWSGGYLHVDGLRLLIREFRPFTFAFFLSRKPPADWDYAVSNKVLELHPGCKRTPADCAVRQNTANFNGIGWGMPAYNPIAEEADR